MPYFFGSVTLGPKYYTNRRLGIPSFEFRFRTHYGVGIVWGVVGAGVCRQALQGWEWILWFGLCLRVLVVAGIASVCNYAEQNIIIIGDFAIIINSILHVHIHIISSTLCSRLV